MSRKKKKKQPVDIATIKEIFDREYECMIYNLFVTKFNEHGWTHEEFLNKTLDYLKRKRKENSYWHH